MGIKGRVKEWYYHITGRDKFELRDVGEAFSEWKKRTNDLMVYARDANTSREGNPLFNAYASKVIEEYQRIICKMPPQDVRKLNRLIKNCGIEILVGSECVNLETN